jgi:hypothetical protein
MAGIVLALAGLTAGDGGPGIGAVAAPVRLRLDTSCWVGAWQIREWYGPRFTTHPVELRWGREWTQSVFGEDWHGGTIVGTTADGKVLYRDREGTLQGIYRLEGGTVLMAFGSLPPKSFRLTRHTSILTLRPAQTLARRMQQRSGFRCSAHDCVATGECSAKP